MRLATALLLAAVPTVAAAQTASRPPAEKPAAHKPSTTPAAAKPVQHKTPPRHPVHKPSVSKPGIAKPGIAKPGAKPGIAKPGIAKPGGKPSVAKPAAKPAAPPQPEPAPDLHKGTNTGLPLPRFAALKTDDVNFRRGPGMRYPIEWVYKRRDLPVEIEREFEVWRLVADPNGSKGWVQAATLTGRRTAVVTGAERTLRQAPSDTAGPVAKLDAGVIIRVRACEAKSEWCLVQINDYRGYIKRSDMWGVEPAEVIP